MTSRSLNDLQDCMGYRFKDIELLNLALTHRSTACEHNERLEFLGDSVLGHIISELLYERYPNAREGELSRMRSSLVCGDRLAEIAQKISLGKFLRLGVGEKKSGGQQRHSILSDAIEALIAAVYLDGGFDVSRQMVLTIYGDIIENISRARMEKDPKSTLQEWLQSQQMPLPHYKSTVTGEAHSQTFSVECMVEGLSYVGKGLSSSRRKAEQLAAQHLLELIDDK